MSETPVICNLPVFTSPAQQLTFYLDDPTSYQQVLTVMNPCEFPVRFQILVQASDNSRYTLNEQHGFIQAHHRQMVIVQHNSITSSNIGVVDKLKISMTSKKPGIRFHKKELPMALLASRGQWAEPILSPDTSEYFSQQPRSTPSSKPHSPLPDTARHDSDEGIVKKLRGYIFAFILGVVACWYWKS